MIKLLDLSISLWRLKKKIRRWMHMLNENEGCNQQNLDWGILLVKDLIFSASNDNKETFIV